jgi:hypothetical protein
MSSKDCTESQRLNNKNATKTRGYGLKKIAPREGRRENFWDISCEKSRFYAKKSYFSNIRGAHEIFGVLSQKFSRLPSLGAIFLSAPPPNLKSWIRPWTIP